MAEKKVQKIKAQSDYLSDSKSSEDKVNPHLCTSQEKRVCGTIKGSAQDTRAVLSHTTMQHNPTVERGPPKQPKISKKWQRGMKETLITFTGGTWLPIHQASSKKPTS